MMNKYSIFIKILSFFIALWIMASCNPKPTASSTIDEDARKYASLKCEMRLKLIQMQSDSTRVVTKAEIDSIRKVMNKELKKIRLAYESDSSMLRKFEAAVISEQGKLDECRNLPKPGKAGKQR